MAWTAFGMCSIVRLVVASLIWVVEMARVRLGLGRHEQLNIQDKRHAAVLRLYREARWTPLLDQFFDRYADQLNLGSPRGLPKPAGAVKGHRSPSDAPPK